MFKVPDPNEMVPLEEYENFLERKVEYVKEIHEYVISRLKQEGVTQIPGKHLFDEILNTFNVGAKAQQGYTPLRHPVDRYNRVKMNIEHLAGILKEIKANERFPYPNTLLTEKDKEKLEEFLNSKEGV